MKKIIILATLLSFHSSPSWGQDVESVLAIGISTLYCKGFGEPEAKSMMVQDAIEQCGTDNVMQTTEMVTTSNVQYSCWSMPAEGVKHRTVTMAQFQCLPEDPRACLNACMDQAEEDFKTCHSQCGLW